MKHVRIRTIVVFAIAGLAGALLLRTSQSVQIAEEKLSALKTSVAQEKDSIQMLNAEWAYLNNPERLERLSKEYLDLMPPQPASITTESAVIPAKIEELPSAADPAVLTAQPVSLQVKPPATKPPAKTSPAPIKSKPSTDKDFTALLKNIQKGTP